MLLTINTNYNLQKKHGRFYLYNKITSISYELSYKLYFILSLFYKQAYSLDKLQDEFDKHGIGLSDFRQFLRMDDFLDLLVPASTLLKISDYKVSENLPQCTSAVPERVDFFITKHCNLSCKHCFEGSAPTFPCRRFTLDEVERLILQLESANIRTLKITGGEPFSHPDIDKFLLEVSRCHFETIILTNALLINPYRIRLIKEGKIKLGISLDGVSEETHDYIRGKGAFNQLKKILGALYSEKITFGITCTVNRLNLFQLDAIVNYVLNDLDASSLFLNRLRPMGRTNQNENLVLSKEEDDIFYKKYLGYKEIYKERLFLSDDSVIDNVHPHSKDIICRAGNSLLAVDENLDVYPCIYGIGFPEYRMGNLMQQDLAQIWDSAKWDLFRGKTKLDELVDCRQCKLNASCMIRNCRLKPVYEGRSFLSAVSYCKGMRISV